MVYSRQRMKFLFFLLSFPYRTGCQLKNWLYNRKFLTPQKAPLPVISVGNIAFGGTEKTPMVVNLISFLAQRGFKPALVSRGYKGKWEKKGGVLSDGKNIFGSWLDSGDEPFLVAQNIPSAGIFIGKNRLVSCRRAAQSGFGIAVLDDGFQHRRLHRDLDIVLYDPDETIALREHVTSLKRAHILLIKKGANSQNIKQRFPKICTLEYSVRSAGLFKVGQEEMIQVEKFREKKNLAFCAIAQPERFRSTLQKEGLQPLAFLKFADHHSYPPSSVKKIKDIYQNTQAGAIITTEKDAVKLADKDKFKDLPFYYLKIALDLDHEFYPEFVRLLQNRGISA